MFLKKKKQEFELSVEQKFLLIATRVNPSEEEIEVVESLSILIKDWTYVISFSKKHGVACILFENINRHFSFKLSESHLQELKKNYLTSLISYQRVQKQFIKVITQLNKNGIIPILMKGTAYAEFLYETPVLRPMSDVDFLVPKDQIRKVENCLIQLGLERSIGNKKEEIRWYYDHHLLPFYHKESGLNIEPHWSLISQRFGFNINTEDAIQNSVKKDYFGTEIRILNDKSAYTFQIATLKKGFFEGGFRLQKFNDLRLLETKCTEFTFDNKLDEKIIKAYITISKQTSFQFIGKSNLKIIMAIFNAKSIPPLKTFYLLILHTPIHLKLKTLNTLLFPNSKYFRQKFKNKSTSEIISYYLSAPKKIFRL